MDSASRPDYAPAVARCLTGGTDPQPELVALVREVLELPSPPDRAGLEELQRRIEATPGATKPIGLVYGGATKIKGYVFEAPKLPEIRGASALLDWLNNQGVSNIWHAQLDGAFGDSALVDDLVIYASGGSFLAFAPASVAQDLATAVERCYTEQTLTGNSVAVQSTFGLLELRFGRDPRRYWVDEFIRDCSDNKLRDKLFNYYYPPEGVDTADIGEEALRRRFYNRKSFGELMTILATMYNCRRDERASHGEVRALHRFELLPWAVKCQSSDVRPAVVVASTSDESDDDRFLSEPSARKLAVGRAIKRVTPGENKLEADLKPWTLPPGLADQSWERRWERFLLEEGSETPYAQTLSGHRSSAARDVGEIGAASKPGRYIGLIYADGNNIGRLMATISSPAVFSAVSQALSETAIASVLAALAEHLQPIPVPQPAPGRPELLHPFEILAIGGDDLFVVVPGDRACAIALDIARRFEQELTTRFDEIAASHTDFRLPPRLPAPHVSRYKGPSPGARVIGGLTPAVGLSAGVLVAQENAPFFFLRGLVEELLKNAKGLAKRNANGSIGQPPFYGGAVDFMVLKATTMVTDKIGPFRAVALNDHKGSKRRLTARPYAWGEFAGLLATARALRSAAVPRSQLYRLRRALDHDASEGVLTSVMEYLYTRARQPESVGRVLFEHIETAWSLGALGTASRVAVPPWSPQGTDGFETVWPDLLEILDFVAGGEA